MTRVSNYKRLSPLGDEPRTIATVVNNILDGKVNSTGSITLTNSSATTTLSDDRIGSRGRESYPLALIRATYE